MSPTVLIVINLNVCYCRCLCNVIICRKRFYCCQCFFRRYFSMYFAPWCLWYLSFVFLQHYHGCLSCFFICSHFLYCIYCSGSSV